MAQHGIEADRNAGESSVADNFRHAASNAREALLSEANSLPPGMRPPEYSLASGKLSVFAHTAENMNGPFGHAWISFKLDQSGKTTTYGTYLPEGLHINDEKGYLENHPERVKISVGRTAHIDDQSERRLNNLIRSYRQAGSAAWTFEHPCSDFAAVAWQTATGEVLNHHMMPAFFSNPGSLKQAIISANGGQQFGHERRRRR
jgi:hypothetical protein